MYGFPDARFVTTIASKKKKNYFPGLKESHRIVCIYTCTYGDDSISVNYSTPRALLYILYSPLKRWAPKTRNVPYNLFFFFVYIRAVVANYLRVPVSCCLQNMLSNIYIYTNKSRINLANRIDWLFWKTRVVYISYIFIHRLVVY